MRGEVLCYAHLCKRGLYRRFFTQEEDQEIEKVACSSQLTLDDVIEVLNVLIGRVLDREKDGGKALPLVETDVRSLIAAFKARGALSGEAADGLATTFAQALEELSTEVEIEL